jgi:hypothetical protein
MRFGGVYLLTSNIKWYNLNNDISEKLSVYSLDFYLKHDQSQGIDFYIQINTDILQIPLNAFSDAALLNDFVTKYDWISYNITGLVLTVTIPSIVGAVYLLTYENGALRDTAPFALDSQYVDPLYVYTSQNDNNIDEIGSDIKITVGKIGGLPVALWQYQAFDGILEIGVLTENTDYTTDGNTIDFSDEGVLPRSSYVQISKKGKIYGQCCRFEVGDYYSEYFTIITEAQKQSLKLLNLTYSSEFMDLNVAFSSLWTAGLLVNAQLLKGSGSDIEVFIGQQSNTNLENFSKRIRVFKTGAIPDYLSDMLSNIFGFDTIQIEGENYAAEEGPEESQFEERTDLFQLEIILRKQNFDFLI